MTLNRFEKIKHYREEINKLLKEKPSLIPFQNYIDTELHKAGNQHNRIAVMENMIYEHRLNLINGLDKLKKALLKIGSKK